MGLGLGPAVSGWCLNSMIASPYFSAINARLNQLRGRLVTCWNRDTFLKAGGRWLFVLTAEYFVCMCRLPNRGCLFCL